LDMPAYGLRGGRKGLERTLRPSPLEEREREGGRYAEQKVSFGRYTAKIPSKLWEEKQRVFACNKTGPRRRSGQESDQEQKRWFSVRRRGMNSTETLLELRIGWRAGKCCKRRETPLTFVGRRETEETAHALLYKGKNH